MSFGSRRRPEGGIRDREQRDRLIESSFPNPETRFYVTFGPCRLPAAG